MSGSMLQARVAAAIAAVAVVWLGVSAVPLIGRAGYSPDEEITATTVAGIAQTGAPTLPSGLLYLRGLAYSYAAWIGGTVAGQDLRAYRFVSLLFGAFAVVTMFRVAREMLSRSAAVCAALLLATFPLHIGMSAYARFYTAYMALMLVATGLFIKTSRTHSSSTAFLASCAVCRLTAEFALFLALFPLCGVLCAESKDGRRLHAILLLKTVAVFIGIEAAFFLLTRLSGSATPLPPVDPRRMLLGIEALHLPSGAVFTLAGPVALIGIASAFLVLMAGLRRLTGVPWAIISLFATAGFFFQSGLLIAVGLGSIVAQPRQAPGIVTCGVVTGALSAAIWGGHTFWVTDAEPSLRFVWLITRADLGFPWEPFREMFRLSPAASVLAAAAVAVSLHAVSRAEAQTLALATGIALTALSLSPSGIHTRYLYTVSGALFIVSAAFVDRVRESLLGVLPLPRVAAHGAAAVAAALLIGDTYMSAREQTLITLANWPPDYLSSKIESGDVLICNDELACHYLLGRVDYWLLTTAYESDRFTDGSAGDRRGVYAGARLIANADQLEKVVACSERPVSLVMLDLGKFDIINSRAWSLALAERRGGAVTQLGERDVLVRIESSAATRCAQ